MDNQQVQNLWIDYSILFILGIVLMGGLGYIFWKWSKKYEGQSFGDIINIQLVKEKITIFVFGMIVCNVAEAMMAASITVPGEVIHANPFTRFLIHMAVGIVGIVCGVYTFHYVRVFAQRKYKNKMRATMVVGTLLLGTLLFPFLNLVVIAKGMGDLPLVLGLFVSPVVAMTKMTFVTAASTIATLAHLFMVTIDGLLTSDDIATFQYAAGEKDIDKSITEKGEEAKKGKLDNFEDGVAFLLRRHGYKTDTKARKDEFDSVLASCWKNIDKLKPNERYVLADRVHKIVEDVKEFEKNKKKGKSQEEIAKANEEFRDRIDKLFAASTKGGKGFGRQLAQRGK